MNTFDGINVMNVDPMTIYKDSRIRKLTEAPLFSETLEKTKDKIIKEKNEKPDIKKQIQLKKLRDASNELVSFLFFNMIKSMRATIPKDPYLDGGMTEDIFQDMMDHEYAKNWVSSGKISLAEEIYNQLSKHIK